jgi:hypothetical protein
MEGIMANTKLGRNVSINYPKDLEGNRIGISINAKTKEEFTSSLESLKQNNSQIDKLLDSINEY